MHYSLFVVCYSVIKRLGLNFSLTGSSRRYGKVPFSYGDDPFVRSSEKMFFQTASGSVIASVNIGRQYQISMKVLPY